MTGGRPGLDRAGAAGGAVPGSDEALVEQALAGRDEAFDLLVARYKDRVYNYVWRLLSDPALAEDVTQEVLLRAYSGLKGFGGRSSFSTWLFRIATNQAIDGARKRQRQRGFVLPWRRERADESGEESEPEFADSSHEPQAMALQGELREQIERAMAALPEKQRTVLLLYDVESLQYEEIAEVLSVPVGTVKSRLFHARAALRRRLAPYLGNTYEESRKER